MPLPRTQSNLRQLTLTCALAYALRDLALPFAFFELLEVALIDLALLKLL